MLPTSLVHTRPLASGITAPTSLATGRQAGGRADRLVACRAEQLAAILGIILALSCKVGEGPVRGQLAAAPSVSCGSGGRQAVTAAAAAGQSCTDVGLPGWISSVCSGCARRLSGPLCAIGAALVSRGAAGALPLLCCGDQDRRGCRDAINLAPAPDGGARCCASAAGWQRDASVLEGSACIGRGVLHAAHICQEQSRQSAARTRPAAGRPLKRSPMLALQGVSAAAVRPRTATAPTAPRWGSVGRAHQVRRRQRRVGGASRGLEAWGWECGIEQPFGAL